jgi:hypothetical protein
VAAGKSAPKAKAAGAKEGQRRKRKFPWIALVLLLATVYFFWVLPNQLGDRPVNAEFLYGQE